MRIAILGFGKMGKAIEEIALSRNHVVTLKLSSKNKAQITDAELKKSDVAIDFSTAAAAVENYERCFNCGVPIVSGTTGWLKHWNTVIESCNRKNGSFFYASNFSIGVNIFFHLNKMLAKYMSKQDGYNAAIKEVHHIHKLDSPSGTAITLAQEIIEANSAYDSWALRLGNEIKERILPVEAEREGDIPGIHTVTYHSVIDEISIRHKAFSREGFALGAVLAAEFLQGRKGVFGMEDMLKL